MASSWKTLLLITSLLLCNGPLLGPTVVVAEELAAPASQPVSSAGSGKFHLRLLDRAAPFKRSHIRNGGGADLLQDMRKMVNGQPRVLEVVDFQLDDGDLFDSNSKRFDDYGHPRYGKRNEFDDYGHSRYGRRK